MTSVRKIRRATLRRIGHPSKHPMVGAAVSRGKIYLGDTFLGQGVIRRFHWPPRTTYWRRPMFTMQIG